MDCGLKDNVTNTYSFIIQSEQISMILTQQSTTFVVPHEHMNILYYDFG